MVWRKQVAAERKRRMQEEAAQEGPIGQVTTEVGELEDRLVKVITDQDDRNPAVFTGGCPCVLAAV